MHQFDLLYMPSDTLYGNKYKYILAGIDAASRFKVARPLRTKQARDVAEMIADIYKVGPLKYPKIFQCDNGSEFKEDVTKMLEKIEVKIQRVTTKYKHTHTAFVDYRLREIVENPGNRVMYYLSGGPERAFISEELMLIPEDTELPPDYVQEW